MRKVILLVCVLAIPQFVKIAHTVDRYEYVALEYIEDPSFNNNN